MKHSTSIVFLLACAASLTLTGCSDPADKVAKADTSTTTNNAVATSVPTSGQEFVIQPDSKIEFTGSKVTGSHNGGFKSFDGKLKVAQGKIIGSPQIKIDMQSAYTDAEKLTGHLKSPDFFDVAKYPTSTFTVTSIEGDGATTKIVGNLDLHGVIKAISFPAKIEVSDTAVHLTAEFAINRKEFNIVYPGKPDDLIRDNVVIRFDLKAVPGKG